ncbi:MAG: DUF4956 domain-containing protein [Proteiniphilum sp.]|jgi:hypothetical protein|uniref:DUF4956 domain-containing protein n=1 Tax=Proteiniphilum sp. TaxID=1926877 RepID=UPI002B2025EE|nr:DUF4956 domain-containing protein [Proteiniphilum sp.]MEA5127094.1 DUF4956 domain-containing protein [Proteiniphilum sp.]
MDSIHNFFNGEAFADLIVRFLFNLLITGIIVYFFYFRKTKRRDYLFTFLMVSTTIFLMIFLLDSVKIQVGFALGLFAIFGILRYRTDTLPVREMTYLFAIIGISVINALSNGKVSGMELLFTNLIFIIMFWALESIRLLKHVNSKLIIYERIELITPDREAEMLADLCQRSGLNIERFEVGQIDFLKDIAYVKVYYSDHNKENTADNIVKPGNFLDDF